MSDLTPSPCTFIRLYYGYVMLWPKAGEGFQTHGFPFETLIAGDCSFGVQKPISVCWLICSVEFVCIGAMLRVFLIVFNEVQLHVLIPSYPLVLIHDPARFGF